MLQKALAFAYCVLIFFGGQSAATAAPTDCIDLAHCSAVLELANELKVKPSERHQQKSPSRPRPRPATPDPTPVRARPPAPSRVTCPDVDPRNPARWLLLKPKVTNAAIAIVENSKCATCKQEDVRALQELWGRAMVSYVRALSCALESDAGEVPREELRQELRRVFSGSMAADAGDSTALLTLMLQEKARGNSSLPEVLELSERLQDPATRRAFIQRLETLGGAESGLSSALDRVEGSPRLQQDLLDLLLKAERASLALGMSFVTEHDMRARRLRGVRGIQLVVEKSWSPAQRAESPLEMSARDYVQGLKELLTMLTTEGIREEKVTYGNADQETCACVDDRKCQAVMLVRLTPRNGQIDPAGVVRFRQELAESCARPRSPNDLDNPVPGRCFAIDCAAGRSQSECTDDRVSAAAHLMNQLSYQFSVFGDIAFLTVDRRVETISATFHPGVSIDDLAVPIPQRLPRLLGQGLAVNNRGCAEHLHDQLVLRLRTTYSALVGAPIGKSGRARLELTKQGADRCTVRVHSPDGSVVYGLSVRYQGESKEKDAGEDVGRTLGQFYYNLRQAEQLAQKRRYGLPMSEPATASSEFARFWQKVGRPIALVGALGLMTSGVYVSNTRPQASTGDWLWRSGLGVFVIEIGVETWLYF